MTWRAMEDLEESEKQQEGTDLRGSACDGLLYAFLEGAKWWEHESTGFTMWQSDQEKAWKTAECRLAAGLLGKPRG